MTYKCLRTTIFETINDRFRDTSSLPRDVPQLGLKLSMQDRMKPIVNRLQHHPLSDKDKKLLQILKHLNVDTFLNNRRHLHRNKHAQHHRKINEEMLKEFKVGDWNFISTLDRVEKIVSKIVRDASGRLTTERRKISRPAKRVSINRKKEQEEE